MLQVSRKFEYGLHAVAYLASRGAERVVTVKEMAEEIGFSPEFLAKAMQSLTRAGIARSVQGVKGGYQLARKAESITVADIGTAIEGAPHLVRCVVKADNCEIYSSCPHRGYMTSLQNRIQGLLASTTVQALLDTET
ncbi:MAG: Rrf2 family transcriptional regulator [Pelodictyon luteolum]|uniref:Rrf2 family transcriptional regulator n=1 Tax=Pelodictyon luteolum TaxID=1100 RepID=A0A165MD84_PELLU|nr:Rrf2 family transcriptional regulator [Pelodictyon luteolum]KZK75106.1 MAG: Rrf2 family transcriptional regulator [Pelodictyon luteolum]